MIDELEKNDCIGCKACKDACSLKAISFTKDDMGFEVPTIDYKVCSGCNRCTQVCPVQSKKENNRPEAVRAFAGYNISNERKLSTSGGIFPLLARYIIDKQGVVYGAKFDKNFHNIHDRAITYKDSMEFVGSKYVQSDTSGIYVKIKQDLLQDKYVLFTGLPCQTEALLSFLGKKYDKLLLVDLVCFGIGSPGIFTNYINEYYKNTEIKKIIFKDKVTSWKDWKIKIEKSETVDYYSNRENLYMNSYLKRINLRESCYNCKFKGIQRNSDITIGDCWGIGEENLKLNDGMGLSSILVHTLKGMEVFEHIKKDLKYGEYDLNSLMSGNPALYVSSNKPEERKKFAIDYKKYGIRYVLEKYCVFNNQNN